MFEFPHRSARLVSPMRTGRRGSLTASKVDDANLGFPLMGNKRGTITPEHPIKPCNRTDEKAKRVNKITCLGLPTKQGVGCSNHPGGTN